jgi:hypothetical protein
MHLSMGTGSGPRNMAHTRQSSENKTTPLQHVRARTNAPGMSNRANQVKQPAQASAGLYTLQLTLPTHVEHPPLYAQQMPLHTYLALPGDTATALHSAGACVRDTANTSHRYNANSSCMQHAIHCAHAVGAR